jgi:nitroreductase
MPVSASPVLPPEPDLTDTLPEPRFSAEMLTRLALRRSAPAQALMAPGPSPEQVRDLLRIAARAPDHGKLFPWRFLIFEPQDKALIVERLSAIAVLRSDSVKAQAVLAKFMNPPFTVAVISSVTSNAKPEWEQRLSSAAVCMNMLHAADAMGFGANWITDWYSYDPDALAIFGVGPHEQVAGFIHVGTPPGPTQERPRPDVAAITTVWRP